MKTWQGSLRRFAVALGAAGCIGPAVAAEVDWVYSQAELQMALGGAALQVESFTDGLPDGVALSTFGPSHVVAVSGSEGIPSFAGLYEAAGVQVVGGAAGGSRQFLDTVSSSGQQQTVWFFHQARHGVGAHWDLAPWGLGEGLALYAVFDHGESLIGEISAARLGGSRGYLGFTSDQTFSAVILRGAGLGVGANAETYAVDNIAFGNQAPVPEPETILLWAAGLTGLALVRRRNRPASNA